METKEQKIIVFNEERKKSDSPSVRDEKENAAPKGDSPKNNRNELTKGMKFTIKVF